MADDEEVWLNEPMMSTCPVFEGRELNVGAEVTLVAEGTEPLSPSQGWLKTGSQSSGPFRLVLR